MIMQNTPEWLEIRKKKVGASDAPAIMGVSPWTTPYQLWQEKLDLVPRKEETWQMAEGKRKEHPALLELEKLTGYLFAPEVKYHSSINWMMASLDAIDPEGKVIAEIKCPGAADHAVAQSGKVPEKYFPQVQHQLEVCELDMAYYFSFHITGNALIKVYRDDAYIKRMLKEEEIFYEQLQTFEPPPLSERDYDVNFDPGCISIAQQLIDVRERLKAFEALEKEEKRLREQLIGIAGDRNLICDGVKLTRYFRKGAVEYGAIPELSNVDIEKYRKKPVECFKISITR